MTHDPTSTHLRREEVEAYLAGELPAARETLVEEHLADCDACTQLSRTVFAALPVFEHWTARAHGDAYLREALNTALESAEAGDPALRDRVADWRSKWAGVAEAAVHLVLDAPLAASHLLAAQVPNLSRPGATLQLAPAGVARTRGAVRTRGSVRPRGSVRTRGSDPTSGPADTNGLAAGVVDVRRDGDSLVVQLRGLPGGDRVPLVMLISVDDPTDHHEQESVGTPGGIHVARFEKVGPGNYLVVIEPLS